ncbi:UTRA domain-containing protein [Glycomyces sp. YM15]|uniref:UTRA domain-containing protein n=1 Tax=Glycomyces sp. YM15 TaxID=2800446 RepID=UPI0019656B55|nr:UTRA domain-containing protein [Glycomyces sp. YM15]
MSEKLLRRTIGGRKTPADQRGVYADAEVTLEVQDLSRRAPSARAAAALGVTASQEVLTRFRVQAVDGVRVQIAATYFPDKVAEALPVLAEANTGAGGFLARLEEAGHELDVARSVIDAVNADAATAAALAVDEGTALIREVWTVKDTASGEVLAATENLAVGGLVEYVLD